MTAPKCQHCGARWTPNKAIHDVQLNIWPQSAKIEKWRGKLCEACLGGVVAYLDRNAEVEAKRRT